MIATVRIVCKAPPTAPNSHFGIVASAVDTRVYLRKADGTEIEIPGVTRIVWSVACDDEPSRATLEIAGVEIDAEALLEATR